eukprot:CAMPEP_0170163586 /NCGR_PEP_ID=MMETSP0033_2-20121228/77676_1 /TAXON_ID=195969 /ORGANISM="Dolichomastix tenuilepis, Strain CCMP3274" /LENGTH=221 /DNA_ID=CAMNT_0010401225 /DNA_START=153 /DNA_END=818 /DNA_ORIENTATION=+
MSGPSPTPNFSTKPGMYHRHMIGLGLFSDEDVSIQVNGAGSDATVEALYDVVRITKGGKVGIGTVNPQAKLHIEGDVKISGTITSNSNEVAWHTCRGEDIGEQNVSMLIPYTPCWSRGGYGLCPPRYLEVVHCAYASATYLTHVSFAIYTGFQAVATPMVSVVRTHTHSLPTDANLWTGVDADSLTVNMTADMQMIVCNVTTRAGYNTAGGDSTIFYKYGT